MFLIRVQSRRTAKAAFLPLCLLPSPHMSWQMRLQGHGELGETCPRQRRRFSHAGNGFTWTEACGSRWTKGETRARGRSATWRPRSIGHSGWPARMASSRGPCTVQTAELARYYCLLQGALCRACTMNERDKAAYITYTDIQIQS